MTVNTELGESVLSQDAKSQVQAAIIDDAPADDDGKAVRSPLTLALLRTRWLLAFATPGHGRGATFRGAAGV
jgi:hypothetical protein